MKTSKVEIKPGFNGFLAESDAPEAPALLLIHEIFGINSYVRELAMNYARSGYTVLVPDLFWRVEPGIELDPSVQEQRERAMQLNSTYQDPDGLADLEAAIALLRTKLAPRSKVGAIGYCLGGRLAFRLGAKKAVDSAVVFYGVNIQKHLDEATSPSPMLVHIAGTDYLCPPEVQRQIDKALKTVPDVEVIIHEGAGHAFARPNSQHYAADAARTSAAATAAFLSRTLNSQANAQ